MVVLPGQTYDLVLGGGCYGVCLLVWGEMLRERAVRATEAEGGRAEALPRASGANERERSEAKLEAEYRSPAGLSWSLDYVNQTRWVSGSFRFLVVTVSPFALLRGCLSPYPPSCAAPPSPACGTLSAYGCRV